MKSYEEFLASKHIVAPDVGFEATEEDLNPALFGFQRAEASARTDTLFAGIEA